MLVLTAAAGERIFIGEHVTITVLRAGSRIKLGINAPRDVLVDREEVRKRRELSSSVDGR